jgi:hypothetical protein
MTEIVDIVGVEVVDRNRPPIPNGIFCGDEAVSGLAVFENRCSL